MKIIHAVRMSTPVSVMSTICSSCELRAQFYRGHGQSVSSSVLYNAVMGELTSVEVVHPSGNIQPFGFDP